jgi:hypothetical protein
MILEYEMFEKLVRMILAQIVMVLACGMLAIAGIFLECTIVNNMSGALEDVVASITLVVVLAAILTVGFSVFGYIFDGDAFWWWRWMRKKKIG